MQTKYIPSRHGNIWSAYFALESAKGLVILADGSGEHRTIGTMRLDRMAAWLNRNQYEVLAFDKYGCGESEGDWKTTNLDILRDSLIDVCSQSASLSKGLTVLLGQSEGSKLAFEVATSSTPVDAFVSRVPSHQEIKTRLHYQLAELLKDQEAWETWSLGIKDIEECLSTGSVIEGFLCDHPKTYWASCLNRKQPGDLVPDITKPFFVLNGDDDKMTPPAAYEKIHQAIDRFPNRIFRKKIYPKVGHSLLEPGQSWENSEPAKDIISWLDDLASVKYR